MTVQIGKIYKCLFDTKAYHDDDPKDLDLLNKMVIVTELKNDAGMCKVYSIEDGQYYRYILFDSELEEV
jgi:hypothetical protein